MANNKDRRSISVLFSKGISSISWIFLILFSFMTLYICILEKESCICIPVDYTFLNSDWKNTFFSSSVCIWGFTLTCAIFLLEHLKEVHYGISLKQIIVMCFDKINIAINIIIYMLLIPSMVITYYNKLLLLNAWFHTVNYAYGAGLLLFISMISVRDTVIELIRSRSIEQLRDAGFNKNSYNDEQFPIFNLINKLDYDDMWH